MSTLRFLSVAILIGAALVAVPTDTQAQEVIYQYSTPLWHPESVHYHRTYQGRSWNWSHSYGLYLQDNYVDVPHVVPGHYSYTSIIPMYVR